MFSRKVLTLAVFAAALCGLLPIQKVQASGAVTYYVPIVSDVRCRFSRWNLQHVAWLVATIALIYPLLDLNAVRERAQVNLLQYEAA